AEKSREANKERYDADRDLKEMIARLSASNSAESKGLRNDLLRIQAQLAQQKLDEGVKAKGDQASVVASTRQQIRDLAQGLIEDPDLDAVAGSLNARMPTVRENSVDAERRFNQHVASLALGER